MKTIEDLATYLETNKARLRVGSPGSSSVRKWTVSVTSDGVYGSGVEPTLAEALKEALFNFETSSRIDAAAAKTHTVTDEEKLQ